MYGRPLTDGVQGVGEGRGTAFAIFSLGCPCVSISDNGICREL